MNIFCIEMTMNEGLTIHGLIKNLVDMLVGSQHIQTLSRIGLLCTYTRSRTPRINLN